MVAPINQLTPRLIPAVSAAAAATPNARYTHPDRELLDFFSSTPRQMKQMRSAAEQAAEWLAAADKAGAAAKRLSAAASLWQMRSFASAEPAKLTGHAEDGAQTAVYLVRIDAVAAAQTNVGYELASNGSSVIEPGRHRFMLSSGGEAKSIQVSIGPADTNAQALGKLLGAINEAGCGLRAERIEDRAAGTVRLVVRSEATGEQAAFALADVDGSAVSATGIAGISSVAADAVYRVNGGPVIVSPTNRVPLDRSRVMLELKAATDRPVVASVGLDDDAIADAVADAVRAVSRLPVILARQPAYLDPAIRGPIDEAMASAAAERLGIVRSGIGWSLNDDELRRLIVRSPDAARRLLAGPNGWAARIIKAVDRYAQTPAEALLSSAARGLQLYSYSPQLSGLRMDGMMPAGGWYVNTQY